MWLNWRQLHRTIFFVCIRVSLYRQIRANGRKSAKLIGIIAAAFRFQVRHCHKSKLATALEEKSRKAWGHKFTNVFLWERFRLIIRPNDRASVVKAISVTKEVPRLRPGARTKAFVILTNVRRRLHSFGFTFKQKITCREWEIDILKKTVAVVNWLNYIILCGMSAIPSLFRNHQT